MKEFCKKNVKLIILLTLLLLTLIIVVLIITRHKHKAYEVNEINYSLKYDSTWKIAEKEDLEISLIHKKSKSKLDIKIIELDEMQYKSLDELFSSFLYNLQEQNKDYKLIYREKSKFTKNNVEGYKTLFESDEGQTSIYFYKQGNKLVTFIYEATFDYFDILLDNVNTIIYNFSLNAQKFDVVSSINLNTKDINYLKQENVSNVLNNTKEYEIVSSNYLVNYSIPSNFKSTSNDTEYGNYSFEGLDIGNSIYLDTSILNYNIYEYLDEENTLNVYSKYSENLYNKNNSELNKLRNEPLSYIYRNSYKTNEVLTEKIVLLFELNKNHILIVEISSKGVGIPKELIDMIKINKSENVASDIKN